ncbi:MAG: hypothetical protein LBN95_02825 [Prevotellaceae bacterium]|jgi:hypothetical protein|nr:hypothetical protein [Prevotellaceae bacterium]
MLKNKLNVILIAIFAIFLAVQIFMCVGWLVPNIPYAKRHIAVYEQLKVDVNRVQQTDTTGYFIMSHHNYTTFVEKANPYTDTVYYSTNGSDTTFYVAKDEGVGYDTVSRAYLKDKKQQKLDDNEALIANMKSSLRISYNYIWGFVICDIAFAVLIFFRLRKKTKK